MLGIVISSTSVSWMN